MEGKFVFAICDSRRVFHRPLASGQPQGCLITELSRFSDSVRYLPYPIIKLLPDYRSH